MDENPNIFEKIVERVIHENRVSLLVSKEPMADEYRVKDNIGLGPVTQFYILLNGMGAVLSDMIRMLGMEDEEEFLDNVLGLVKESVLEFVRQEEGEPDAAE